MLLCDAPPEKGVVLTDAVSILVLVDVALRQNVPRIDDKDDMFQSLF